MKFEQSKINIVKRTINCIMPMIYMQKLDDLNILPELMRTQMSQEDLAALIRGQELEKEPEFGQFVIDSLPELFRVIESGYNSENLELIKQDPMMLLKMNMEKSSEQSLVLGMYYAFETDTKFTMELLQNPSEGLIEFGKEYIQKLVIDEMIDNLPPEFREVKGSMPSYSDGEPIYISYDKEEKSVGDRVQVVHPLVTNNFIMEDGNQVLTISPDVAALPSLENSVGIVIEVLNEPKHYKCNACTQDHDAHLKINFPESNETYFVDKEHVKIVS